MHSIQGKLPCGQDTVSQVQLMLSGDKQPALHVHREW